MIEKPEHHKALIVQVTEILPIKDADKIELVKFGLPYQAVSQKGNFKIGDLAVYIQPDSVVPTTEPFKFIWEPYQVLVPNVVDPQAVVVHVPEKRRRITVKKIRGEWSEGLLLPVKDFPELYKYPGLDFFEEAVGADVSDKLGVTHYQPAEEDEGQNGAKPVRKTKRPKTVKGWFFFLLHKLYIRRHDKFLLQTESVDGSYPKYDVSALKSVSRTPFIDGEQVIVTEKIHGSSARFVYLDGKMYAGSRNLWLAPEANGYPRAAMKIMLGIEIWCTKNEGFALYGEVVGTQKGYDYNLPKNTFIIFDIRHPDGHWLDAEDPLYLTLNEFGLGTVPTIWWGAYKEGCVTESMVSGQSFTGASHIREGVVIRAVVEREVRRGQRAVFKIVSNQFLAKDSK